MAATGLARGLASEATYGPLPGLGLPGHEEILLFVDDERGIEVAEAHRDMVIPAPSYRVADIDDLPAAATSALPQQALIVRPATGGLADATSKGITGLDALRAAIAAAAALCPSGLALVEPDLRAHHNPSRRRVLARVARALAHRLATPCPSCGAPGYGRVESVGNLPCRVCATPTESISGVIHGCAACPQRTTHRGAQSRADPADCPACNP